MKLDSYVKDRRRRKKKQRMILIGAAAFLGLYFISLGIGWLIFRSPFVRAEHVIVDGNTTVASSDVVALLQSAALRDHSFTTALLGFHNLFAWPTNISSDELAFLPQLASISVSRDFFSNTLDVSVRERAPFGVWCFERGASATAVDNGSNCYWFDDTGVLFAHSPATQGGIFLTVHDASQKPRGLNQDVLPDRFLPNFLSIIAMLRASNLRVTGINLQDIGLEEVNVTTANGPTLNMSLRFLADDYLPVIKNLMTQPGFSKLAYIDCRTENRVYYK